MAPVILQTGFENIKHSIPFTKGTLEKGAKLAFCHIKHIEEYVDDGVNNRLMIRDLELGSQGLPSSLQKITQFF